MKYIFKGNLSGHICEGCNEAIAGQMVRIYLPEEGTGSTDAGDHFRLVTFEEQLERQDLLIAWTETDEQGNFIIELEEKYAASTLDIDFLCADLPCAAARPDRVPMQFHLGRINPEWRAGREPGQHYFGWQYAIPDKWWHTIRGRYLGAWMIRGKLIDGITQEPLEGVTITAMDADLFKEDQLGTALTDASGYFRIDYTADDFRKNSICLNLETDDDFPFFSCGPDVYFIADYKGTLLLQETAADRRDNVPYCLCVSLSTTVPVMLP